MKDVLKLAVLVILVLVALQIFRDNTSLGGKLFVTAPTVSIPNGA